MGWISKASATPNSSKLYTFYIYGGELYIGSGPTAKLIKFDGISSLSELTLANSIGGSTFLTNIRYSSEIGHLVVCGQSRIDYYDEVAGDLHGAPDPTLGYLGDHAEDTGNGRVKFGGWAANDRQFHSSDTDWSSFTISQQIASQITRNISLSGQLYCATAAGGLWVHNGVNLLVQVVADIGESITKTIVFNGKIYAITNQGKLWETDGSSAWVLKADVYSGHTDLRGLCEHSGEIYTSSGSAWLLKWNGTDSWVPISTTTESFSIEEIISFGGEILGASADTGDLLVYSESFLILPSGISSEESYGTQLVQKASTPVSGLTIPYPMSQDGDMRIDFDERRQYADLVLSDRDVDRDGGLETAILITLLTDRRADDGDPLPDQGGYKGGWWGDSVPVVADYKMGTKLWLLQRSKTIDEVPAQAEEYLREGFSWMIDDGIIEQFLVSVSRVDRGSDSILAMNLGFLKPSGETIFYKFYYNWQAQILRRQNGF